MERPNRLKIVHVVRSPIGGIFRHIVDLVDAQTKAGHDVGIVCDSLTGGRFEDEVIASIAPKLALGATRALVFGGAGVAAVVAQSSRAVARANRCGSRCRCGCGSRPGVAPT